jgi:hypothetical protein
MRRRKRKVGRSCRLASQPATAASTVAEVSCWLAGWLRVGRCCLAALPTAAASTVAVRCRGPSSSRSGHRSHISNASSNSVYAATAA